MADEESFVILGTSPLSSICSHGNSLLNNALEKEATEADAEKQQSPDVKVEAAASINQLSVIPEQTNSSGSSLPATLPSGQSSLAASFLMGEVEADVLKNSVYSQFPSLCSLQSRAEDLVKLQTMMNEYKALKQTLDKVNRTMEEYYKTTQQWRYEAATREQQYQEQLQQCQAHIKKLTVENEGFKIDLQSNLEQMRLAEELHQKEHDELRQTLSEKSSLISNLTVEIEKLQAHQLPSYEYVPDDVQSLGPTKSLNNGEEDGKVKEMQRQMSALLAENLEFKDMRKTYIEEIDCLKVNLTSAEELMKAMSADINALKANDAQKDEQITNLRTQIEIYRRDFEMERADREKNAGEKEQYLIDLRALQRRNQELIEALAEAQKPKSFGQFKSAVSSNSLRENQRPVLDPTGAAARTADCVLRCPICSKQFTALTVLQTHVNDCLDKN